MTSHIKNILPFLLVTIVFVLVFFYFLLFIIEVSKYFTWCTDNTNAMFLASHFYIPVQSQHGHAIIIK